MATAFGLSASNYLGSGTSLNLTIPAVSAGDAVVVLCMTNNATTFSLTSTGTTPTQLGSTQATSSAEHGLWTFIASGGDAGATLTLTVGLTGKLAIALVSYTGASNSALIDQSAIHPETSSVSTHVTPTVTTVTDQDWVLECITCKETDGVSPTWTVPGTQRVFVSGPSGGGNLSVIITDGNAAVSTGTVGGGDSFVQNQSVASANAVTWTLAISPASSGVNSSPAYATVASPLSGGSGSWVNTANADGAPDSAYATWTAP